MISFRSRIRAVPSRVVPVHVGRGALSRLVEDLTRAFARGTAVVISDDRVAPLHAEGVVRDLRAGGLTAHLLTFPAGEASKVRETKASLEDRLATLGVGRDGVVVAVGGGVTGDLAGFVASTWHRGLPVVQAPTSLLSMVDAALGGKTGVDLPSGKNLVGAFHHPWGVYADLATLATLPEADFLLGFAEVVKSFVVGDARRFARLEALAPALTVRDGEHLEEIVHGCLALKARVVAADPGETGRRAILNFGHTVGHAVEASSSWSVPHGTAVAVGMLIEADLAREATGFPEAHRRRLRDVLHRLGLRTSWPQAVSRERVIEAARRDKKNRAGQLRLALPRRIGAMLPGDAVTVTIDDARFADALRRHD